MSGKTKIINSYAVVSTKEFFLDWIKTDLYLLVQLSTIRTLDKKDIREMDRPKVWNFYCRKGFSGLQC